jgi:hypothetical protein
MSVITVPDEIAEATFPVGSTPTTGPWSFSFTYFQKADLNVTFNNGVTITTLGPSDFTITGGIVEEGGFVGGSLTLVSPVHDGSVRIYRNVKAERTDNFSPAPAVNIRDLDIALSRAVAMVQDTRRLGGGVTTGGGTGGGTVVAGVNTVNGRSGDLTLSAADVTAGFGTQVNASLAAGLGISLSNVGGITTIVSTVNGIASVSNTWSATDHTANVTLSNGNQTTTFGAPPVSGKRGVRGTTSRAAGKVYFEVTLTPAGAGGVWAGLAPIEQDTASNASLPNGFAATSYGLIWHDGTVSSLVNTWVGGPRTLTLRVAADLTAKRAWIRPTSGTGSTTWNNDGTADPATGVGGVPYTASSPLFPISYGGQDGDVVTLNTGATNFAGAIPAGFTAWDRPDAVLSVNGRTGNLSLTGADVLSGLGAAVFSKLAAGTGIGLGFSGDTITISYTGGGGGGAVSSVNGFTGAVNLVASDFASGMGAVVYGKLVAGSGIALALSGDNITVTNTLGGGGIPYQYIPAWENGITTGTAAATNVTNLQNLINTLNAAGGGTIWFNAPGPYQINSTITLKSNVSIMMAGGAFFSWTGGNTGDIIASGTTDVLIGCEIDIVINEGSTFAGNVINLHSCQHNNIRARGIGTSSSSIFCQIVADSTAGDFSGIGRNVVFNRFELFHRGQCGKFLYISGIPGSGSTFGGSAQGVTLNTFHGCQANNCVSLGIQIEMWADTNTFSGNTYIGISGFGGIGLWVNGANAGLRTVYNTRFEQLAIDTFGTGLARYGTILNLSAGMYCGAYFQDPPAENGAFVAGNCHSYQWNHMDGATDGILVHQKAVTTGL